MRLNRNLVVLALAVLCSLGMESLPLQYKQAIARHAYVGLVDAGQLLFSRVIAHSRSAERSRFLLSQNVELALDNMRLREAERENQRLRKELDFRRSDESADLIAAEVIGRDPDQLYDSVVIDVGRDRGVEPEWAVVTAEGLVGHVTVVGPHSAVVQLLMRSPVIAIVQEGRAQGIVSWVNGNRFRLRFVEAASSIQQGDRVISSGLGGRYPKGIPIGVLTEVRMHERNPLFQEVFLESNVDFLGLEEVFVMASGNGQVR